MNVAQIRHPRVDRVTERALYWRSAGFSRKKVLAELAKDFPKVSIAHRAACAATVSNMTPEQAHYRYVCSNLTDAEWTRFSAGESIDHIWVNRLSPPRGESNA
jgi:hypothetical protein